MDVFEIKDMGENHDLYVLSDTLLLADVFESFRDKCIEIYILDPVHFLSASGLAWQACLKKTEVELELLTDIDILLMFENGIRGGICQAIYRHAKANNEYMNNYDKRKITLYLMYLDANNLYGWTMSQKCPINAFKWVKDLSQFNEHFMKNFDENSDIGYFIEVDVEYPKALFNLHKDLPFLPGRKEVFDLREGLPSLLQRKKLEGVKKLVSSIEDKEKYVIHITALKQALNHDLKLQNMHRIIQFNQQAWLKPYIDINTRLRKKAKKMNFFKLMNNSVFEKTMENPRNHRDIKLVTTDEKKK